MCRQGGAVMALESTQNRLVCVDVLNEFLVYCTLPIVCVVKHHTTSIRASTISVLNVHDIVIVGLCTY